jgi:uncharacterized protein with WD repeat
VGGGVKVRFVDFSPNEKYLVTYSTVEATNPHEKAGVVLNIFDVCHFPFIPLPQTFKP